MMKTKNLVYLLIPFLFFACKEGEKITVFSPDNSIQIEIEAHGSLSYRVLRKGQEVVGFSRIGLEIRGKVSDQYFVQDIKHRQVNETLTPLYGKFKQLDDHYNEAAITFTNSQQLVVRAYNDGVAYRFVTRYDEEIIVENEKVTVNVTGDPAVIFAETDNYTSWELMSMDYASASAITEGKKAITPVLYSFPDNNKLVVAESDVRSYPGMYLRKENGSFTGDFAPVPDSTSLGSWGFVSVVRTTHDYIAQVPGHKEFPWRMFIVTDDDKQLPVNELTYKLATPQLFEDAGWVKPGKAAWEWWHDAILTDADIPSGMPNRNTDLYKHYIDFAADYGLEYLMIDAGWSNLFDLTKVNPKVDMPELIRYANSRNVGVFLWCTAVSLTDRIDEFMQMMSDWGAVGLKVDFFDRDDQLAMDWYERIASKAAEYKLMINLHGCSKPTGLQRTYPNIVNFEAVRGNECSKWDLTANPQHHVTIPFTRMLGGALDYTPGAMRNRSLQMFKPIDPGLPLSLGTRAHELAMFVIYDQYFAMLCDSPSEYRKYPDIMQFLSDVPVAFDHTLVLDAKVGEYILMAKQKDTNWYVGGMTNQRARNLTVDFSFLSPGSMYEASVYRDDPASGLYADKYIYETIDVNQQTELTIPLTQGGGIAISIKPKN